MCRADAGASGAVAETLPGDLKVVWETKTAEAIETTPVSNGVLVYVTDVMGGVEALDLESGESRWRREFETGFSAPAGLYLPASVVPNATLTVAPIAMIPRAKDSQPETDAETDVETPSENPSDQPMLVVGDVEGNLHGLNPATGESIWKFITDGEISAPPAFFAVPRPESPESATEPILQNLEIRLVQTSQDGVLYCLNAHTGEIIWKYETGDQIRCAASINRGKTLLGGCDGGLHVVDLATGKAAREPLPLGGPTGSTPAIVDGEVFLPIMDGVVFAFDIDSGEVRWEFEDADRPQEYRSSIAVGKDRVIVSSNNKHVDALDRKTGKRIWRETLRRRADASPLIAGEDVWIASSDGLISRLSLDDGVASWTFESRGKFFAAPAIVGDRLIIADDDGVVRCFAGG